MAHNLAQDLKGEYRMAYTGNTPWHELGTKLNNPMTAAEALTNAKLHYEIGFTPLFTEINNVKVQLDDKKATINKETGELLGVVGNRYHIIQNTEAFNFFDVLIGEGQAIYNTAGALGKGERIWLLVELPDNIIIGEKDEIKKYLVLTNSHDGTKALEVYFTPIRVVCQNTLTASMVQAHNKVSVRHTKNYKNKIEEARRILEICIDYYKQFETISKQLVDTKLNNTTAEIYFDKVLDIKLDKDNNSTQKINTKKELLALYRNGQGNDMADVKDSLWAAYNAVTEYADHHKTVKKIETDPTRKIESVLFGSGALLKHKAFNLAAKVITV